VFGDVPACATFISQPCFHQDHSSGSPPQHSNIMLLDSRTFQDPLALAPRGGYRNYVAQPEGQLLGAEQWQWLTDELNTSTAQINIIASSIQVIAEDHRYEMWANFPNERIRLLNLIRDSGVNNPVLLSGDRHLSEVSKINWRNQPIIDVTASGMTHSFSGNEEHNRHRWGQLVTDESFSTLTIDWANQNLTIEQWDMGGQSQQQLIWPLQPGP